MHNNQNLYAKEGVEEEEERIKEGKNMRHT